MDPLGSARRMLSAVPTPLRDRFRILRMPNPGIEDAEAIAQAVVRGERDARLMRFEELPDFAPDEIAMIRKAWGGGSLRRLNRVIDASLRAREADFVSSNGVFTFCTDPSTHAPALTLFAHATVNGATD